MVASLEYKGLGVLTARTSRLLLTLGWCLTEASLFGQGVMMTPPSSATFWNTPGRFIGSKQCALCHQAQASHFHDNSMSRALEAIDKCEILRGPVHYSVTIGKYSYLIRRDGAKVLYNVTDGVQTIETPLSYAFGQGKAGQTYFYEREGRTYESRVSYYSRLGGLALTVGAVNLKPATLIEAAGRDLDSQNQLDCFGCHTTGARLGNRLQLEHFEPGVSCEACHGPGGAHVDSIQDGKPKPGSIRSLKGMDAEDTAEFCGVCHRTWETVMTMGLRGVNTVRFMPYRLMSSQCFSPADKRIACTACHNPHAGLVTDEQNYDSKCKACHYSTNVAIMKKTCPTASSKCVSCHMPRIDPGESQHAFPDHWIRVVRAGAPYPN
jgi:hypothetical protein